MKDESSQKMEWRKTAIVTVLISATLIAGMPLVVQAPEPTQGIVSVFGNVTYVNGMDVPVGWTVHLQNLDKDMPGEWDPTSNWWGTTGDPGAVPYSYMVTGDTGGMGDTATFRVNVSDTIGVYKGESANFTGTPFVDSFEDITVYPVGDDTDPKTNVTKPPEITDPIPSGTMLNWTEEDVTLTFNRTDPAPAAGVNYTNLSASEAITNVNVSGWITDIPQIGTGNLTIPLNATFGPKFNVTISNECNATIYYYSVDKNMTANVEAPKSVTVRIDRSEPLLCNATTTPSTVVVNITNTTLCVDVTDRYSNIAGDVTVNLTSIGGAWNATMPADSYNYTTPDGLTWIRFCLPNVSVTSDEYLGTHNLMVNVSDTLGHYNNTVNISLNVIKGVPATNLTAVWNQTDNTTIVSWDGTQDAEYTVYVATNKSFSTYETETYTVTGLSWIDHSATTSTLRLYRVNLTGMDPNPNMTVGKFNITIHKGWNLISIPLFPSNTTLSAVICSDKAATDDRIYGDTSGAGINWVLARYTTQWNYYGLTDIEPGKGYFYKRAGEDFEFTVAGTINVSTNTTVYAGWNLLGYVSVAPSNLTICLKDNPVSDDRIYGDTPGTGINWVLARYTTQWNYYGLTEFDPGEGYFYKRAGDTFNWTYTDI